MCRIITLMTKTGPEKTPSKRTLARLKDVWLEEYRESRTISSTCRKFGISRSTFSRWRQADNEFNEKFTEIETELLEVLEASAFTRALKGSDVLTIFLLKSMDPQKYRDIVKHEIDHRFVVDVSSQLSAVIKRLVPNMCPHCKTHLGLTNKIAHELGSLSARLASR